MPGENLLLLVDQFEEIFRFRDQLAPPNLGNGATSQDQLRKDEADGFVRLLLETVKEKAAYVVLTMRVRLSARLLAFCGPSGGFQ